MKTLRLPQAGRVRKRSHDRERRSNGRPSGRRGAGRGRTRRL